MRVGATNWDDWQLDILKAEWPKGTTGRQIGNLVGKSRNAVIGKAHRLELGNRLPANQHTGRPRQERPRIPRVRRPKSDMAIIANKKAVAPKFYAAAVPLTEKPPISIMELGLNTCRAIVGHGLDGLAVYCGDMTFAEKAFCEGHCAMYYQPPNERKRAR